MDKDLSSTENQDVHPLRSSEKALTEKKAEGNQTLHYAELRQKYMKKYSDVETVSFNLKEYPMVTSGMQGGASGGSSEQIPSSSSVTKTNSASSVDDSTRDYKKGFRRTQLRIGQPIADLKTIGLPGWGEIMDEVKNESDKDVFKCSPPLSLRSKIKQNWTHGTVNGPLLEHSFYVKPVSPLPKVFDARKDVYVKKNIVPGFNHLLELSQGDMIEFKLHPPKSKRPTDNRPSAKGASILCFCGSRAYDQLELYLKKCKELLDISETRADFLTSIMSSEAIWFYLFNATCDDDDCMEQYIVNVLDFVFALSDHLSNFPFRRNEIFSMVLQKNLIGNLKDLNKRQAYEYHFIECAVTVDPTLLKDVIPWINRIVEHAPASFTGVMHKILMKLADIVDLSNWKALNEIPSVKEMLGDPLERVSYLRPISLKSGYKDGDDYLNVYYRLLRAECFSAVQKGIIDFRRGKLDPRDMDIYDKVSVVDIDIDYTNIFLSLQFTPYRPVNNWSRSKKLMFGNLLCVSVEGDFSDPIWLTVSERDETILQKHNVIGTELISFHNSDTNSADIIQRMLLNSGKMIMAESPTYFKSFQHVLSNLKNCQVEDFCLYNEIVHGVHNEYDQENTLDLRENVKQLLTTINYSEMEEHQQNAFLHALRQRLAIIQGPPGTGKTYVGAKLVHMFLELQRRDLFDEMMFCPLEDTTRFAGDIDEYEPEYDELSSSKSSDFLDDDDIDVYKPVFHSTVAVKVDPIIKTLSNEPYSVQESVGSVSLTSSDMSDDRSDSSCRSNAPILVLTYKNHALDEFLKHCIKFCDVGDITRLGSQSKEESLKSCLLHEQMKKAEFYRISTRGVIEDTESLFEQLSLHLKNLQKTKIFNFLTFIANLSTDQLSSFANKALFIPWRPRLGPGWPKIPNNYILQKVFTEWKGETDFTIFKLRMETCIYDLRFGLQNEKKSLKAMTRYLIVLKLQEIFTHHWLPDKRNIQNLAKLQKRGATFFRILPDSSDQFELEDICDPLLNKHTTSDDLDEDYINEQLSMRRSAFDGDGDSNSRNSFHNSKRKERMLKKLGQQSIFLDKNDFSPSDFPENCQKDEEILRRTDIWNLSDIDKYTFIYSILHIGNDEDLEEMNSILEQIEIQQKKKKSIDEKNKLQLLKDQKIVGATIVGASINLSLLQKLEPQIVLVEEAAEVLEPCLVAVLSKSVKKLILIGDHKQLKPQVDTFYLRKEFNFHISMMERLISIGFPYKKLVRQGRMRPEFSCMLKDIYPDYEDFDGISESNKAIHCLPTSMFFWSHRFDEVKDRSAQNPGEANMVIALALYFIASGIPEEEITIIGAYLGQVQLIRKLYRSANPVSTPSGISNRKQINIRTIDEYQGDENKFIIVSLTRSNKEKNIGFLREVERRCVAQSRAKCGLYFIGNAEMFRQNKTWSFVLDKMEEKKLVNQHLPICCFRHFSYKRNVLQTESIEKPDIKDETQLMYYVKTEENWCKAVCDVLFECQIEEHRCKKLCTPRHDDSKCTALVDFTFTTCNHKTTKMCYIDDEDMRCKVQLTEKLDCGHDKTTSCHNWMQGRNSILCKENCSKTYSCKARHGCKKVCHEAHLHYASHCTAKVDFKYPDCNHVMPNYETECNKPVPPKDAPCCKFLMKYTSDICGHFQSRPCSHKENCQRQCERKRPDCGHRCANKCYEPCIGGKKNCKLCEIEHEKILSAAKIAAKQQMEVCKQNALDHHQFSLKEITIGSDEYTCVSEKCRVYFSLYSMSRICDIKNIWKVKCPSNDVNFWTYARNAFGCLKEELYKLKHGFVNITSNDHIYSELCETKQLGYEFQKFASRSSTASYKDSIHELTVYISDVMLGDRINKDEFDEVSSNFKKRQSKRDREEERTEYTIPTKLLELKKDSILLNRPKGPASYFVYNGEQIIPTYIVHLKCKTNSSKSAEKLLEGFEDGEQKCNLASFNFRDHSNPLCEVVQKAISLYQGDCSKRPPYKQRQLPQNIKSVGVVVNRECEQKYQAKKTDLLRSKEKFEEIYAYHATKPENIASIIKTNLDPDRAPVHGNVYGKGCYFSEHPQFSFNYGKETMLIFKLLLVKDRYTKVEPNEKGFCQQLVLQESSLFKPQFVLYFSM
ncbi:hypothetical protein ACHWQZ_G017831 [Mnemiopsis leidyi]